MSQVGHKGSVGVPQRAGGGKALDKEMEGLSCASCVTLGRLLGLSETYFSQLKGVERKQLDHVWASPQSTMKVCTNVQGKLGRTLLGTTPAVGISGGQRQQRPLLEGG